MALLQVYAVFDNAMHAFSRPFFVPTRGIALRGFMDECANPQSELAKHPSDYSLHFLAEFDELTGRFAPLEQTELVIRAIEVTPHASMTEPAVPSSE